MENIKIYKNEGWQDLDPNQTYKVATSSYLSKGGCGMSMIKGASEQTGKNDVESVCDYINNVLQNKIKDKYASTDGRINIIE